MNGQVPPDFVNPAYSSSCFPPIMTPRGRAILAHLLTVFEKWDKAKASSLVSWTEKGGRGFISSLLLVVLLYLVLLPTPALANHFTEAGRPDIDALVPPHTIVGEWVAYNVCTRSGLVIGRSVEEAKQAQTEAFMTRACPALFSPPGYPVFVFVGTRFLPRIRWNYDIYEILWDTLGYVPPDLCYQKNRYKMPSGECADSYIFIDHLLAGDFRDPVSGQMHGVNNGIRQVLFVNYSTQKYTLELSNDPAYPPTVPAILPAVNAKNKVLTRARLDLVLKRGGQPAPGRVVPLQSDRGTLDTIQQPPATDAQGKAKVSVDTRDQPGPSKITDNDPEIETVKPGVITWLPAKYESDFGLTCYSTELETDYKGRMKKASDYPWCANQLPPASHYQEKFMKRIIFQGSGQATGGEIIQYKGCYHVSTCPRTASTECAQAGTTIAVARKAEAKPVVPFKSTVDIDQLGTRRAHDTGSTKENRIYGYRIDVYNGSGLAVCRPPSWGDRNARVKLLKY